MIASDSSRLAASDLCRWLAIGQTMACNGRVVLRALEIFGSINGLFEVGDHELARLGFAPRAIAKIRGVDWDAVDRERDILRRINVSVVPIGTCRYPARLSAIASPPPVLYCRGDLQLLNRYQIAVIGARAATRGGLERARAFARSLAAHGLVVTSGLARGIDAAAHRGALDLGAPSVAVTATGADRIYPGSNTELARELLETGMMVTEFPLGTPPLAANFPRRNRIISGLGLGVLVVEASLRSGSLITARFAADEGREVFAVPGSVDNPLSRGCHALIRDGAKLVESAVDILEEFAHLDGFQPRSDPPAPAIDGDSGADQSLDAAGGKVLEAVGYDPVAFDQLVGGTGLTTNHLSSILLTLELDGWIDVLPGNRYVRTAGRKQ